jgi:hypothetical protein
MFIALSSQPRDAIYHLKRGKIEGADRAGFSGRAHILILMKRNSIQL